MKVGWVVVSLVVVSCKNPPAAAEAGPASSASSGSVAAIVDAALADPCSGADVDLYAALHDPRCRDEADAGRDGPLPAGLVLTATPSASHVKPRERVEFQVDIANTTDTPAAVELEVIQGFDRDAFGGGLGQDLPSGLGTLGSHRHKGRHHDGGAEPSANEAPSPSRGSKRELGGFRAEVRVDGAAGTFGLLGLLAPKRATITIAPHGHARGHFMSDIRTPIATSDGSLMMVNVPAGTYDVLVTAPVAGANTRLEATTRVTVDAK